MQHESLEKDLRKIFTAALKAVDPETAVHDYFARQPVDFSRYDQVLLGGIGKAGVPMARAVETAIGSHLQEGRIIVKHGHGGRLEKTGVSEAGHPEPDRAGTEASQEMVEWLESRLTPDSLLIFVVSGGGSALFPLPAPGLTLEDKQNVTRLLIRCGATIQEINTIRKHLSRVKGGRLLEFTKGARVLTLILSDVVGDDFASIASGPTAPDPTTYQDCFSILDKYELREDLPKAVLDYLEQGLEGGEQAPAETPKPGDPRFKKVENILVANNLKGLLRASERARDLGYEPLILSSSITGNTEDIADLHVALAEEVFASGHPLSPPCCLISGGETTVEVRGQGKGGRNTHFTLQCAKKIADWQEAVLFASIGSDGNDGPTDAAGAVTTPLTARRAREMDLDVQDHLTRNDSYHFFQRLDDLVMTGPTQTNVMDFRFVLCREKS